MITHLHYWRVYNVVHILVESLPTFSALFYSYDFVDLFELLVHFQARPRRIIVCMLPYWVLLYFSVVKDTFCSRRRRFPFSRPSKILDATGYSYRPHASVMLLCELHKSRFVKQESKKMIRTQRILYSVLNTSLMNSLF